MKVIGHQDPGKSIGYRRYVMIVQPRKVFVVFAFLKNVAAIDATLVNVVISAKNQLLNFLRGPKI